MGKFTFGTFVSYQWAKLNPALHVDLSGKTVIVIGANTGIGFEAAKHFAQMKPARLILGCRSEERGRKALEAIAHDTGYAAELQLIDLANFASVQDFAKRIGDAPVDILVMNAGVAEGTYKTTVDNWESTLQINHLATALLSFLLTPNMVRAAKEHNFHGRLVIVCSEVHWWAQFGKVLSAPHLLNALNGQEYSSKFENFVHRYPDSKLLNVFFTRAFAEHLQRTAPVIAASVNPGYCYSELRRNAPFTMQIRFKIMDWTMGRSAEGGARQLVWAALGPDGQDGPHVRHLQGAYVSNAEVFEPSDFVISKQGYEAQEKLWSETVDILKQVAPQVENIVQTYF